MASDTSDTSDTSLTLPPCSDSLLQILCTRHVHLLTAVPLEEAPGDRPTRLYLATFPAGSYGVNADRVVAYRTPGGALRLRAVRAPGVSAPAHRPPTGTRLYLPTPAAVEWVQSHRLLERVRTALRDLDPSCLGPNTRDGLNALLTLLSGDNRTGTL